MSVNKYPVIQLGHGLVKIADGTTEITWEETEEKSVLPSIVFERGGSGIVGQWEEGNRLAKEDDVICVITFANEASLDILMLHLNEVKESFRSPGK